MAWTLRISSVTVLLGFIIQFGWAPVQALAGPVGSVQDELLVAFHPHTDVDTVLHGHGAARLEHLAAIGVHRVRVPAAARDAIASAFAHHPQVKFVELNRVLKADATPDDPLYASQWHLPKIDAPGAWALTTGTPGIVIAILDSGVDPTHPDLAAKLVPGYNFYDLNTNTADVYGHGTKVAGAAAALGNNGTQIASVAWNNGVMPMRVTDVQGYGYDSAIANALVWAADHGARVMNISFAGVAGSATITSAAQYVVRKQGLVVAAAGNCGCLDPTPKNPSIISVSATDQNDNLASWSSRGDYVAVAAPGAGILTTANGGGYATVSGTSFSSPITAGVLALMLSVNPTLTPADAEALLRSGAVDLGAAGWDSSFGAGRIDAYRAVAAAMVFTPAPDSTAPTVSITSPTPGAAVSGTVAVTISASDAVGVARVSLYVDGTLLASATTAPYTFSWDTRNVASGAHRLTAQAADAAGNVGTSASDVVVASTADTTAPSVAITSTLVIGRKLYSSVSATDNVGVVKVNLYLDGALAATSTAAPYRFNVNWSKLGAGTHTLQAKAFDAAGNAGVSAPKTLTK